MLGEIDCREGLLRAVEKDAYPNLESSMKHTSGIFADVLKSIVKSKPNLKVYSLVIISFGRRDKTPCLFFFLRYSCTLSSRF